MVRCDVQRWNMQKQIDATRYIVPYKMDDHYRIAVCASPDAHCITRSSYIVTSLHVTLWRHSALRCDVTPRCAVTSLHVTLWRRSALRCGVTPRCAVTSLRVTLSRDFSPDRHPAIGHIHVKMVTLALEHTLNMRHAFHTTHKCETRQDILYVKCSYSPCMVSSESLLNSYRRMASFSSICVEIVHGSPENNQKKKVKHTDVTGWVRVAQLQERDSFSYSKVG